MKTRSGFTIVEMLVGLIAASILALTAGTMLANVYRGWIRSLAAADLERDAAVAVHTLDVAVRGGSNAVAEVEGLKVYMPSNAVVRAFYVQSSGGRKSLLYNRDWPGGAGMVIVDSRLGSFTTSVTAGVVRVTMTLLGIDQNDRDTGITMSISNLCIRMRN